MALDCGHEPSQHDEHTTGTAQRQDGKVICWDCAAMCDLGRMLKNGNSKSLPLYLSTNDEHEWRVSNWPGTLTFTLYAMRKGRHNIGRTRHDVWFDGPDGYVWHGVSIGEWTQVCHCKRTTERWYKFAGDVARVA